ncbi:putative nicotinate-nucleotide adenylyltransferase [Agarivorans sp. OAG1]|uniref:nicotinate-nucleotide adenylyltransferase n=1 Tax=Agarivorans sp. OAG1 TaxID=3082387 RepID=UPI002B2EBF9E|nr:putative nicotinate-nucleotide adenylyltransferase [Agarivorans sp. OAG1]
MLKLFFGGSFDPIHLGHVISAQQLLAATHAADITLLPNALSPLKEKQFSTAQHRQQLLELALSDYPQLKLDWREVARGGHSYTCDTLKQLANEYPNQPLGFVMGLDSFNHLDKWREWQTLCDYAHLIVIARPGYHLQVSEQLSQWFEAKLCEDVSELSAHNNGKIYFCQLQEMDMSSSEIRQHLLNQANLDLLKNQLSEKVLSYILQHKLYGA